jgi:hypothetical protein
MAEIDMFTKTVIRVIIFVCCSHVLKAEALSSLNPDPMNAALLYYQAFLKHPKPDEVIAFLVYDTSLEELDHFFRTGECVGFHELKEEVQGLEAKFRGYGIDLKQTDSLETAISKIEKFSQTVDVNEPAHSGPRMQWPGGAMPAIFSMKYSLSFDLAEYRKQRHLRETLDGQDFKAIVEDYLDDRSDVFELLRAASRLTRCDWGYQYSKGIAYDFPQLNQAKLLSSLIQAKILKLAADAQVQEALEYCLVLDKIALHVGDDAILSYLTAIALKARSLHLVQYLLPYIGSDTQLLTGLKESLMKRDPSFLSLSKALQMDFQLAFQSIRKNEALLKNTKKAIEVYKQMTNDKEPMPSEEALVTNASMPLRQYCIKLCEIIEDKTKSFSQKKAALAELADSFEKEKSLKEDPAQIFSHPELMLEMAFSLCAPSLGRCCMLMTRSQADSNVTLISIDLLLYRIREGQFPDTLPKDSPKDPYTGKDFEYTRNQDGFILAWDKDNLSQVREEKFRQYEFKMQRPNPGTVD